MGQDASGVRSASHGHPGLQTIEVRLGLDKLGRETELVIRTRGELAHEGDEVWTGRNGTITQEYWNTGV